jgi:hypothetical protein
MHLESQRGQTLPFWTIGVLIALSMLFFLANYGSAIAWQFRAQNAADSAASSALSVQANVYNEYSILLYSAALDEYRLRVLNQAILNTLYGKGGCDPSTTCAQNYYSLINEYNVALNGYTNDIHLLDQANNVSQGGQSTDQLKALSMMGTQCNGGASDYNCQFAVTALATAAPSNNNGQGNQGYIAAGDDQVDVISCKNVPYFFASLLNMKGATYKVIGRAAAAVVPANHETFNPGTQINPSTGQPFQPVETQWAAGYSAPAYQIDFSGLNVNLYWYQAGAVRPFAGTPSSGSYTCS